MAQLDARWEPSAPGVVPVQPAGRWLWITVLAILAWSYFSLSMLDEPEATVTVAAIQLGNTVTSNEDLDRLEAATLSAAASGAQLIVWSEGVLPVDPMHGDWRTRFEHLAIESGAYLVLGYVVSEDAGIRNEAALVSPSDGFVGVYGKAHPVTWAGETSLTRGTYPAFATSLGDVGIIICYDLDFTSTARRVAGNGARIIAVPSMDWAAIADLHYTHVVFRAIENRVSMVKADVGFSSAAVDPYGRLLAHTLTREASEATLLAAVPVGPGNPLWWLGDWCGWLALGALTLMAMADIRHLRLERIAARDRP